MKTKLIFSLSVAGVMLGLLLAYIFGQRPSAPPPVFQPTINPYASGIYATGIIESDQASGANINMYPEVSGNVTQILVHEGQVVDRGTPLLRLDDSTQRAIVAQQQSQAQAALALLDELKAQPREETLQVAIAQVAAAEATLKNTHDQLAKQRNSFELNPKSVSKDTLDNVVNADAIAAANLDVVKRQYELIKSGAWKFDILNQERQYNALVKSVSAAQALLDKYIIKAPTDGVVLSINAAVGAYVSPQGAYSTYTGGADPMMVMGSPQQQMAVRCYVDEILVQRLPPAASIKAQMTIHGSSVTIPLQFVRVKPYVTPKIELSNQRTERVDLRVLPLIFKFKPAAGTVLYPGQIVDVYIGQNDASTTNMNSTK